MFQHRGKITLVLIGLGMSLVIASLTKSALSVESRYSGSASGINNAASRFASLMSVAILGVVALSSFSPKLEEAIANTELQTAQQQAILKQSDKLGGIVIPENFSQVDREEAEGAIESAFTYSFRRVMLVGASTAFGAAILCYFFIDKRARRTTIENE